MKGYNLLTVFIVFLSAAIASCSGPKNIRPVPEREKYDNRGYQKSPVKKPEENSPMKPEPPRRDEPISIKKDESLKKEKADNIKDLSGSDLIFSESGIRLRKTELTEFRDFAGPVISVFSNDEFMYYIRSDEKLSSPDSGRRAQSVFGSIDLKEKKVLYEKILPVDVCGPGVRKFFFSDNTVSVLCNNNIFYSIDITSMNVNVTEGVMDVVFNRGDLIFLKAADSGNTLVHGSGSVKLTLTGPLKVGWLIHNRLAVINGTEDTEVVDIVLMKSLTVYSSVRKYRRPDPHNIIICMSDKTEVLSDRNMIYYRIFVNGLEKGRTETGPAAREHRAFLTLSSNEMHLVRLERWKLNPRKNMYERENNVMQPDILKIEIDENRVILLNGSFNGKDYSFEKRPAIE